MHDKIVKILQYCWSLRKIIQEAVELKLGWVWAKKAYDHTNFGLNKQLRTRSQCTLELSLKPQRLARPHWGSGQQTSWRLRHSILLYLTDPHSFLLSFNNPWCVLMSIWSILLTKLTKYEYSSNLPLGSNWHITDMI